MDHAYYRYYTYVRPDCLKAGWDRDRIVAEVNALGVPCFTGVCGELYREKAFVDSGYGPKQRLPNARNLAETSLCFLVDHTLNEQDMDRTCAAVKQVFDRAAR